MSYKASDLIPVDGDVGSDLVKTGLSYGIVLVVWQVLSMATGRAILPGPAATFEAVYRILTTWSLAQHIFYTLFRTVVGTVLTGVFALLVVIAATYVGPVRYFFEKVIYPSSRALPAVSFALLAIIWFGLGNTAVIFVVFITILPVYLVDLWEELKVTDQPLLEMARSLTSNEYRIFRKVLMPMLVPRMFSSTKLNFSIAFKLALVGELLAAQNGMGYRLYNALNQFETAYIFAWTFLVIALIMLSEYYVFDITEDRYLTRWVHDAG